MKVRIASVKEIVDNIDFIKNHDINLISIRDAEHSHYYDIIDGAGLKNLFVIQFDDLVDELPIEYRDKYKQKPPSENDIVNILEWAKNKMVENSQDIIVQCTAGISRSSAVAILINYLKDPENALSVINPMLHCPNEKVLEIGGKLLNTNICEPVNKLMRDNDEEFVKNHENL